MTNALAALEGKVTEIQQDVLINTARVGEPKPALTNQRGHLRKSKRITLLEPRTDNLENRVRRKNLCIFRLQERAEGEQTLELDY